MIIVIRKGDRLPEGGPFKRIYVGRPGPLGNPYIMRNEADRSAVIAKFRDFASHSLRSEIWRLRQLHDRGINLALECWCAPKPCHGDVIKELILS
jgi:hypothetical protein